MQYISTRGSDQGQTFSQILLAGLARDGGLYMPEVWPQLSHSTWQNSRALPFDQKAAMMLKPFVADSISTQALEDLCKQSFASFRSNDPCPLVQLDEKLYVLELFHGPTLAFKDVAMQVLARLMDLELKKLGKRAAIIGATSGDTGSAAIEAFKNTSCIDMFILFPKGKVSNVQQRQMTTINAPNVHALAIDGNFDDAQAIVKGLFQDTTFASKVSLSGVNSINWARIAAQTSYFAHAALQLPQKANFCVPTGNFGDVFAGYVAMKMGLPINHLIVATNTNDILARALNSSHYTLENVEPTSSPSMDIQVSSNFERLLFEASHRNADEVKGYISDLAVQKSFSIKPSTLNAIKQNFSAYKANEAEVFDKMRQIHQDYNYIIDPHTAVGMVAAQKHISNAPTVVLSTAHPAKFPDAVEKAIGVHPQLPEHLSDLLQRKEHFTSIDANIDKIKTFIEERVHPI